MAEEEQDEFATDSGLRDDFDAVIAGSIFAPGEYGTTLTLTLVDDEGGELDAMYRVGPDWQTFDGGLTIEHPQKKERLNANSQISTLVKYTMEAGAEDVIRKRSAALDRRGPRDSRLWPGLKFHWNVVSTEYNLRDQKNEDGTPVKGVSNKQYPSSFLGEQDVEATSTASSTGGEIPEDALTIMRELAQQHEFKDWVNECLKHDECRVTVVVPKLSDEGFYNQLKG